jgi:hypothetical protein
MTAIRAKELTRKPLSLGIIIAVLCSLNVLAPRSGSAQAYCADEVYSYCWSQGRLVDPYTCECNMMSCLWIWETNCMQADMHIDYSTCTCTSDPSYMGMCDVDPFALGCPRSFDTVFGDQLRVRGGDPLIGGGDGDICSFNSYAWCNANNGSWSSYGCACSGVVASSASSPQQACGDNGGTWYNPGSSAGGGVCYNPSGYGAESQCTSGTGSLNSCVSSGGRWNPYTCTCTP